MKSFQEFLDIVNADQLAQSVFEDCSNAYSKSRNNLSEGLTLQQAKEMTAFSLLSVNAVLGMYHEWLVAQIEQQS